MVTTRPDPVMDALRVLDLERTASWAEIRSRYRALIRNAHPDVAGTDDETTAHSAMLNAAWQELCRATANGSRPLPPEVTRTDSPASSGARSMDDDDAPRGRVVLRAPAGDVFVQLLEAAHELGDVCYLDPEAGLIQVLLGAGPASPQLLIAVDIAQSPALASFRLDSPDAATAPELRDVVALLAGTLAAQGA